MYGLLPAYWLRLKTASKIMIIGGFVTPFNIVVQAATIMTIMTVLSSLTIIKIGFKNYTI